MISYITVYQINRILKILDLKKPFKKFLFEKIKDLWILNDWILKSHVLYFKYIFQNGTIENFKL